MSDNPFSNRRTTIGLIHQRLAAAEAFPRHVRHRQRAALLTRVEGILGRIEAVLPSAPPAVSVSPLAIAASPVLQLLGRLHAMRRPPDPQALRECAVQFLHAFERQARDTGVAMELLRPTH
jgi:type VI secretion system protein ImpK